MDSNNNRYRQPSAMDWLRSFGPNSRQYAAVEPHRITRVKNSLAALPWSTVPAQLLPLAPSAQNLPTVTPSSPPPSCPSSSSLQPVIRSHDSSTTLAPAISLPSSSGTTLQSASSPAILSTPSPSHHRHDPIENLTSSDPRKSKEQLPTPVTEEEKKERDDEWETRNLRSEDEVQAFHKRLKRRNNEVLGGQHTQIPTLEVLKTHWPYLPKWTRELRQPKWKGRLDESLLDGRIQKIFRFVYNYSFSLPLSEADRFVEQLCSSRWVEEAQKGGHEMVFAILKTGIEHEVRLAREIYQEDQSARITVTGYTGMGAGSKHQKNDNCRPFDHAKKVSSLWSFVLKIIGTYQARSANSEARLSLSIVSHLPAEAFNYSRQVFMAAEVIHAIAAGAGLNKGFANVVSCGDFDIRNALRSHLSRFNDNLPLKEMIIVDVHPRCLTYILLQKARMENWETVAEMKRGYNKLPTSKVRIPELQSEEEDLEKSEGSEGARKRKEQVRAEEEMLRKEEGERFAETVETRAQTVGAQSQTNVSRKISSKSTSLPSTSDTPVASSSNSLPPARPPPNSQRGPVKAVQLDKIRTEHSIDSCTAAQLEKLINNLPYKIHNVEYLLRTSLHAQRNLVHHFLQRNKSGHGKGKRHADNYFDADQLSSAAGARFSACVALVKGTNSKKIALNGLGLAADGGQLVTVAIQTGALLEVGRLEVVMKWSTSTGKLLIYREDGINAVEVHLKGGDAQHREGVRQVGWDKVKLVKEMKFDGIAKVLGLK